MLKKELSIKIDYLSIVFDTIKADELIRRLLGLPLEYFMIQNARVKHKDYTNLYQFGTIKVYGDRKLKDGTNWYAYCENNPVNYIDWWGLRTYIINGINNNNDMKAPEYIYDFADELRKEGIEGVRVIPAYKGNKDISKIEETMKTIKDIGKWLDEVNKYGNQSEEIAERIIKQLETVPLKTGEELNFILYSGGAQIGYNVTENLKGKYKVDNVIFIGAPIIKLDNNLINASNMYDIWSDKDWISKIKGIDMTNIKRVELIGFGHTDYFTKVNLCKTVSVIKKWIK